MQLKIYLTIPIRHTLRDTAHSQNVNINFQNTEIMKNKLNYLLLFTLAFCSCNNSTQNENNIEEDIMTIVRKDGWLFQSNMGCDQLSDFEVGGWDVKGIWITKDSLIAIIIREGRDYKFGPKDQNNLSAEDKF